MRLYIEGHNHKNGYAIARSWSDAECSTLPAATPGEMRPVRYVHGRQQAFALVARWNRRFAGH